MSNIDKRALREAAEKALSAKARLALMESVFDDDGEDVKPEAQEDIRICVSFNDLTNPATVLALLDELEAKDKQIDDLKATAAHSNAGWKEAHEQEARAEAAEKRIADLEAREVTLPAQKCCPAEYAGSVLWSETEVWNQAIYECEKAIRAAGIGKGE